MIITTKNSHPQKTRDQEIFTASQFVLEGTRRRCSNTEKPSRNGERATITTKGKTKTSSRNPWRAASFEGPCLQWQEEPWQRCLRSVPPGSSSATSPALLSQPYPSSQLPSSQSQSLFLDQSCSKYKMKKQTHCQSRILSFSPHFADVIGIGLQIKNTFSLENEEKNSP